MTIPQTDYTYDLFNRMLDSLIEEKRKNPKNNKKFKKYNAKINLGLQIEDSSFIWLSLIFKDGIHSLNNYKLENNYDLILKIAPEDLMFFCNGEYSVIQMLIRKNSFGSRKLRFSKGTTGRNYLKLLKLSKLLVLDKTRPT